MMETTRRVLHLLLRGGLQCRSTTRYGAELTEWGLEGGQRVRCAKDRGHADAPHLGWAGMSTPVTWS